MVLPNLGPQSRRRLIILSKLKYAARQQREIGRVNVPVLAKPTSIPTTISGSHPLSLAMAKERGLRNFRGFEPYPLRESFLLQIKSMTEVRSPTSAYRSRKLLLGNPTALSPMQHLPRMCSYGVRLRRSPAPAWAALLMHVRLPPSLGQHENEPQPRTNATRAWSLHVVWHCLSCHWSKFK